MTGFQPAALEVLLCDADDNLFASERLAFEASCEVTNAYLETIGSERRFAPDELRALAAGRNFRATAEQLAQDEGIEVDRETLTWFVGEERRRVSAHLERSLRPDPSVTQSLERLASRFRLAAVSSSASARLDGCFRASRLESLFPAASRFSAADSLPHPTSKPDPAVYLFALDRLGVAPDRALAIEDSLAGVQSAVAAGIPTFGNLAYVTEDERAARREALTAAGAAAVVDSWRDLEHLLA